MDLETLEKKKKELENSIYDAVSSFYEHFKAETGMSPLSIDINIVGEPMLSGIECCVESCNVDLGIRI